MNNLIGSKQLPLNVRNARINKCVLCTLYKSKYNTMELHREFPRIEILKMSKKNFKFMMLLLVGWHLADGKENPETLMTFWRCGTYDSVICLFCAIELRMSRMWGHWTPSPLYIPAHARGLVLFGRPSTCLNESENEWNNIFVQNNEWIVLYSICAYL